MAPTNDICTTPGCVTAAADILQNLHPDYNNIDPCQDFDQYICGGFGDRYLDEPDTGVLDQIQSISQAVVENVLNSSTAQARNQTQSDDTIIINMLKDNYASCMDVAAIKEAGSAGIPGLISRVAELFPMEHQDYKTNKTISEEDYDSMADAIAYLTSIGVPVFGQFWSFQDMQNPETMVPWFAITNGYVNDIPLPPASRAFSSFEGNKSTIEETLKPFLPRGADVGELAQGVLDLYLGFAALELTLPTVTEEAVFGSWETSTVQELAKDAPAIVVDRVIKKIAKDAYNPDRLLLSYKSLYPKMSKIVSQASKAVVQAFMFYRVVENYAQFITIDPTEERSTTCFSYLDQSLPWIASKVYLDKMYSPEARDAVKSLAEDARDAFIERVDTVDWLDEESKKLVKDKLRDVVLNIGYPSEEPNALSATSLLDYYSGVNISSASYFSNALSLRQWASSRFSSSFGEPVNRAEWLNLGVHSYTANARAFREENLIMLPAGISQSPMFDPGFPDIINYARMGYIAGHEITHHFDNLGSLISNARIPDKHWWGEESLASFEERKTCMVDQYDNLPVKLYNGTTLRNPEDGGGGGKPLTVLGNRTLSENMADQGGLGLAFDAWKKNKADKKEKSLPGGLNEFTNEQLFFIAAGQSWCDNYSEETVLKSWERDEHSPSSSRVRGMMANSKEFKAAFQCKKKEADCEFW